MGKAGRPQKNRQTEGTHTAVRTRDEWTFSATVRVTSFSTSSTLSTLCKDLEQVMDQTSYELVA